MKQRVNFTLFLCLAFSISSCTDCKNPFTCWNLPYEPCPSTFTDERDGQTYTARDFGDQCWMTQNLNFGQMISHTSTTYQHQMAGVQKHCYDDNAQNCATYGGLYSFLEATSASICPDGWYVPSDEDFKMLERTLGITEDLSICGLRGTDQAYQLISRTENCPACQGSNDSKFNALFGGECSLAACGGLGEETRFLTNTSSGGVNFFARVLDPENKGQIQCRERNENNALSVRCIKRIDS